MGARGVLRVLPWIAGGCVLYISVYLVMSRVTAVTWETRAWESRANLEREVTMFAFFGQERRWEDVGHVCGAKLTDREEILDKSCYCLFFPLIEIDARCRMRYHASRSCDIDGVSVW
jgi:hypothetical protein